MQDFFSRYKLSMLIMYTYHTMVHYTVGFSICISLFICLLRVEFFKDSHFDCSLLHFVAFLHLSLYVCAGFFFCLFSLLYQLFLVLFPTTILF